MNQVKKYRAAIVGCGRIASEFDDDPLMVKNYGIASHAGAYRDNPEIELIAVADICKEKLSSFGKRWGISSQYDDYEEMFSKENIEILSICTPNSTHLDVFEKAVNAGIKAIFCEKPISDSLENADKMVELANKKNIMLFTNHRRRWDDLYRNLKKFIESGALGEIQQASCYYTAGVANTGCHIFDVLRMFFGEAEKVTGWRRSKVDIADPNMDGYILFEDDIPVTVQSMDITNYLILEFDIYGSKGRLRIKDNGFDLGYWSASKSKRYAGLNELMGEESPIKLTKPEMFKNAMKNIVNSLRSKDLPECTGEDGVKALEIITAFHLSAKLGNSTISLPVKDRKLTIKST